jgi:two-component system, chemotaxis family, chemotaxis protein CheY
MAKVMVVDDSIMIRKLIKTILEKANHTVVAEAGNGEEAYYKYRVFKPDLVTMDVSMPEVNGIEGVKRIINDYPDALIIMVSAISQKDMILESLESGARHYIIKPITIEKFQEVLDEVLNPVRSN